MRRRGVVFSLAFSLMCMVCTAASALAGDVFDVPCTRYGVPKTLVMAIAQQESSLHPWAVNVAGKDFMPATREEALAIIRAAEARRLSHDVGLMQVNNWWLQKLGISAETALEPNNNAMLGVWILAREFRRHGYGWKAVGAYHSPTPERQQRYALLVARRYEKLLQKEKDVR